MQALYKKNGNVGSLNQDTHKNAFMLINQSHLQNKNQEWYKQTEKLRKAKVSYVLVRSVNAFIILVIFRMFHRCLSRWKRPLWLC